MKGIGTIAVAALAAAIGFCPPSAQAAPKLTGTATLTADSREAFSVVRIKGGTEDPARVWTKSATIGDKTELLGNPVGEFVTEFGFAPFLAIDIGESSVTFTNLVIVTATGGNVLTLTGLNFNAPVVITDIEVTDLMFSPTIAGELVSKSNFTFTPNSLTLILGENAPGMGKGFSFSGGASFTVRFVTGPREDQPVPVPLPGAMSLFGVGLAGMALLRRRARG